MPQQAPTPTPISQKPEIDLPFDASAPDMPAPEAPTHFRLQGQIEFDTFLPPPALIERYNSIIPDYGERLLRMTESHEAHRRSVEKSVLEYNFLALRTESSFKCRGQWFAFLICLLFGSMGFAAILKGFEWGGALLSSLGLAPIVGYFIIGQYRQGRKSGEKSDDSETPKE